MKKSAKKPSKKRTVRRQVDVYRERFVNKQRDATAEEEKFKRASTRELMVHWKTLMKSARDTQQYIVAMFRERIKEIWIIEENEYERLIEREPVFENEALFKIVCKFTSDDPTKVQPVVISGVLSRVNEEDAPTFVLYTNGVDVTSADENALDQITTLMSRSKKDQELVRKSAQEKKLLADQFIAVLANLLWFYDQGIRREQFMGPNCTHLSAPILVNYLRDIIF